MNVSVLGCGRWGTFLAWYAQKIGHQVTLWGRPGSRNLEQLCTTRRNEYLALPDAMQLTDNLSAALSQADFVIISISAQHFRSLVQSVQAASTAPDEQIFVLCMKGLEANTGKTLHRIFQEEMPDGRAAVWVGPGHVQSFVADVPNCMVVDAPEFDIQDAVINAFGSDLIRFYYGADLIGTEIGAATKNVVGIAAGMLDGLELTALKGALMARAPREISRLIVALGGKAQSAYSLAHLGDYEATLFSLHSHNRRFGEDFVRGVPFEKLAEGVPTLHALAKLGVEHGVDLPICHCIRRVIFDGKDPRKELDSLFARSLKSEFI